MRKGIVFFMIFLLFAVSVSAERLPCYSPEYEALICGTYQEVIDAAVQHLADVQTDPVLHCPNPPDVAVPPTCSGETSRFDCESSLMDQIFVLTSIINCYNFCIKFMKN